MFPITVDLTPAEFEKGADSLEKDHQILINTAATSGEISSHGVVASWTYDEKTLTVTVIKKPWIISDAQVTEGLTKLFTSLKVV